MRTLTDIRCACEARHSECRSRHEDNNTSVALRYNHLATHYRLHQMLFAAFQHGQYLRAGVLEAVTH